MGRCMLTALSETVVDSLSTGCVTFLTVREALLSRLRMSMAILQRCEGFNSTHYLPTMRFKSLRTPLPYLSKSSSFPP